MTRNEQIASIMLEAAELLKNDTLNETSARKKYLKILEGKKDKLKKEIALEEKKRDFGKKDMRKLRDLKAEYNKVYNNINRYQGDAFEFKKDFAGKRGSELQQRMSKRFEKQKALKEAVDLLYERAVLCEDAEEASAYVEKAEELQKAIEDIPEETPVKQDEYNTSVVGGDDEKPELEEIKDLCDNDPEVIKLLTDDEDKSVTVNESIFNFYDI